eukprot:750270-Hanusia_phi.AAC.2
MSRNRRDAARRSMRSDILSVLPPSSLLCSLLPPLPLFLSSHDSVSLPIHHLLPQLPIAPPEQFPILIFSFRFSPSFKLTSSA